MMRSLTILRRVFGLSGLALATTILLSVGMGVLAPPAHALAVNIEGDPKGDPPSTALMGMSAEDKEATALSGLRPLLPAWEETFTENLGVVTEIPEGGPVWIVARQSDNSFLYFKYDDTPSYSAIREDYTNGKFLPADATTIAAAYNSGEAVLHVDGAEIWSPNRCTTDASLTFRDDLGYDIRHAIVSTAEYVEPGVFEVKVTDPKTGQVIVEDNSAALIDNKITVTVGALGDVVSHVNGIPVAGAAVSPDGETRVTREPMYQHIDLHEAGSIVLVRVDSNGRQMDDTWDPFRQSSQVDYRYVLGTFKLVGPDGPNAQYELCYMDMEPRTLNAMSFAVDNPDTIPGVLKDQVVQANGASNVGGTDGLSYYGGTTSNILKHQFMHELAEKYNVAPEDVEASYRFGWINVSKKATSDEPVPMLLTRSYEVQERTVTSTQIGSVSVAYSTGDGLVLAPETAVLSDSVVRSMPVNEKFYVDSQRGDVVLERVPDVATEFSVTYDATGLSAPARLTYQGRTYALFGLAKDSAPLRGTVEVGSTVVRYEYALVEPEVEKPTPTFAPTSSGGAGSTQVGPEVDKPAATVAPTGSGGAGSTPMEPEVKKSAPTLASTGSDVDGLVALMGALVMIGGVLWVRARRR